jgi:hypothetical protein
MISVQSTVDANVGQARAIKIFNMRIGVFTETLFKSGLLLIMILNLIFLSGCSLLHSLNVVKKQDGTNTVSVYTFGCQNSLPDIYVNEQDLSVWQVCPYGNLFEIWTMGPSEKEDRFTSKSLPSIFNQMTRVNMNKCGQIIFEKYPTDLYCGEYGYEFKLWKNTKNLWPGLKSNYNHLEYSILSAEQLQEKWSKKKLEEERQRIARQQEEEKQRIARQQEEEKQRIARRQEEEERRRIKALEREVNVRFEQEIARKKENKILSAKILKIGSTTIEESMFGNSLKVFGVESHYLARPVIVKITVQCLGISGKNIFDFQIETTQTQDKWGEWNLNDSFIESYAGYFCKERCESGQAK